MASLLNVGAPSCGNQPNILSKEIIIDKDSAHVYMKSTWHLKTAQGGYVDCLVALASLDMQTWYATSNPQPNAGSSTAIVVYHQFDYAVHAGEHYQIIPWRANCSLDEGLSDITISTDPIA